MSFRTMGVFLLLSLAACSPWADYRSPMGRFSASFPRKPSAGTYVFDTPVGRADMIVARAESGGNTFQAGFADLPPDMVRRTTPKTLLQSVQQQAATNANGKISDVEWDADLQGLRFLLLVLSGPSSANYFLVRGNRLYEIQVIGTPAGVRGDDAARFLNSLAIQ